MPLKAELITNIKEIRKLMFQRETIRAKNNGNKAPRQPEVTQVAKESELKNTPNIPATWAWMQLGDLVWSLKDGPHFSPKYSRDGIPFISGGNIRPEGIDYTSTKYVNRDLHEEFKKKCFAEKWDVLYTKGGTTGMARVNTYDFEFNVWVHVAVLKPLEVINPFYFQHALNSHFCYLQFQKMTHGVGNQDLGLTRMKSSPASPKPTTSPKP